MCLQVKFVRISGSLIPIPNPPLRRRSLFTNAQWQISQNVIGNPRNLTQHHRLLKRPVEGGFGQKHRVGSIQKRMGHLSGFG